MSGDRQHYLPASLIGGFGEPDASGRRRRARLAAWVKDSGLVERRRAESLAYELAVYRLQNPPAGVDQDVIDKMWNPVESVLPDLVDRLEAGVLVAGDDLLLRDYLAAAVVRHPSFSDQAAHIYQLQGIPAPSGDNLQIVRLRALQKAGTQVLTWRWRVLHSPQGNPRFLINDRGWSVVQEEGRSDIALFMPLRSRVAVLGYPDADDLPVRRVPFTEHLELCTSWAEWFNGVTAGENDPFIREIIGHPVQAELLEHLRDGGAANLINPTELGPYRNRPRGSLVN
jgi:Protein of unknown function (DUF4238)